MSKLLPAFIFSGLLVLVVLVFSQQIEFTSLDLGRHLANGREIWRDSSLLFRNFYSYTETDQLFVNHHWLAGVIYYATYRLGGFSGLSILNIAVWLATFFLAWRLARRRAGFYWTVALALPTIILFSQRIDIRPENFSYLFLLFVWWLLETSLADNRLKRLWWLVPIFIVWVNTHIYFFAGLGMLFFWALARLWPPLWRNLRQQKDIALAWRAGWLGLLPWIKYLGLAALVCIFNPNTWRGLIYPFNILKEYGYEIAENKSVFFLENISANPGFIVFKIGIVILVLSFFVRLIVRRRLDIFELCVALFFSGLALFSSRNVALFALISWVISSRNLSELAYLNDYLFERLGSLVRARFRLVGSSIMLLIILVMGIYLWQDSRGRHNIMKHQLGWGLAAGSFDSADFFLNHGLKGPIFNNYDLGSALIFWLYPQEKVFVDNRPEAYSVKFFQEIYKPMQENAAAWKAQRQTYGFKTIYFSHTDMTPWARTFLRAILQDPDWALVHVDTYTVILVDKKQAEADLLKQAITPLDLRLRLRELQAVTDNNGRLYLASFAETAGLSDIASEIYHQMLLNDAGDGRVLAALGSLYSVSSDPMYIAQGVDYLGRALEAGCKLPGIYNERGLAYFNLREYQKAATEWRAALKIDKHNTTATSYLEQLSELESQGQIPVLTDN